MVWSPVGYASYLSQAQQRTLQQPTQQSPYQQFSTEWQKAYEEAKTTNEKRYEEILKGYQDRYAAAMGEIGKMGATEEQTIGRQYQGLGSQVGQNLISSGLYGTTVLPTMGMGVQREKSSALLSLAERLAMMRAQTGAGLSGDTLGFMERREDVYPDMGLYSQLAQLLGQSGGGGTGSYRVTPKIEGAGGVWQAPF
jgi:hypothetical protein